MSTNSNLSQDEQAVAKLVADVFAAYQTFKPSQVDLCDAPECTIWDLFEPDLVRGDSAAREEFRKQDMSDSAKRGALSINIEEPIIDIYDDVAIARYYLDYEFEPPGALAGRVRITTVARRIEGEWRRVHHHEGVVPTGRPPMT